VHRPTVCPALISPMVRLSPSRSSSFVGSTFNPAWYVSSALSNCFVKNSTCPLREYPLTKVGSISMHFSASYR
jgi:hypothetical protein